MMMHGVSLPAGLAGVEGVEGRADVVLERRPVQIHSRFHYLRNGGGADVRGREGVGGSGHCPAPDASEE